MITRFVRNNFKTNLMRSIVVILSFMVAVALILTAFNLSHQAQDIFEESSSEYNFVVGPIGSDTQQVLSTVFFYDDPIGNITYAQYQAIANDERVDKAIPIAMGDNLEGSKIIGTIPEYFDEGFKVSEGRMFTQTNEMVLGASVAKSLNLKIGDQVTGEHGTEAAAEATHSHADFIYTIVGILEKTNTSNDIVAFTHISSVWNVHHHHHEEEEGVEEEHESLTEGDVTAVLVRCHSYDQQAAMIIEINNAGVIQASNITIVLRKLTTIFDSILNIVMIIIVVVIVMSMVMMFLSMFTAVGERKREIAIMRAVGVGRKSVLAIVLLEALILSVIGAVGGYLLSRILMAIGASFVGSTLGAGISVFTLFGTEAIILVLTPVIGLIAALIPAIMVYRLEPTKYLR